MALDWDYIERLVTGHCAELTAVGGLINFAGDCTGWCLSVVVVGLSGPNANDNAGSELTYHTACNANRCGTAGLSVDKEKQQYWLRVLSHCSRELYASARNSWLLRHLYLERVWDPICLACVGPWHVCVVSSPYWADESWDPKESTIKKNKSFGILLVLLERNQSDCSVWVGSRCYCWAWDYMDKSLPHLKDAIIFLTTLTVIVVTCRSRVLDYPSIKQLSAPQVCQMSIVYLILWRKCQHVIFCCITPPLEGSLWIRNWISKDPEGLLMTAIAPNNNNSKPVTDGLLWS